MNTEIYTPGYAQTAIRFMQRRSLASHGAFAVPLFQPGQRILDLGCGPGTITLDIARRVTPTGDVIGVDRNDSQFGEARSLATAEGLPVRFESMDAYDLSFAPDSLDGVFSHALFEHLKSPEKVLARIRELLKPGGFAALRSPDWGGFVLEPCDEAVEAALGARRELQTRNGGHVRAGRKLGNWMREAGFTNVKVTASYEIYQDTAPIVEHLTTQLEADGQTVHALAIHRWAKHPHALFAQSWFEAVGIEPS